MGWKTFEKVKFPFLVVRLLNVAWTSSLTLASVVALFANVPVAQTYLYMESERRCATNCSLSRGQALTHRPPLPIPRENGSDPRS